MLDHNDDVFRCLHSTMHVHRNAVVSIALLCLAVAGRVAELLIQSRPRNLIFSRVITFAQIVSRGNSVLLVIIAFIQNSAQHCGYGWSMYLHGDVCLSMWDHVEVGDNLPPGDWEGRQQQQQTEQRVTSEELRRGNHYQADLHLWWPVCWPGPGLLWI